MENKTMTAPDGTITEGFWPEGKIDLDAEFAKRPWAKSLQIVGKGYLFTSSSWAE